MSWVKKQTENIVKSMLKKHNIIISGFSFVFFCLVYDKGKKIAENMLNDAKFIKEFTKLNKKYCEEWEDMDEKNYENQKVLINKYLEKLL